jgi:3-oxoacyl-[acyl-carrier-protein] synthase II
LHKPIAEAKIDLVALEARNTKISYVLSNSFGFGGTNSTLILSKFSG